MIYPSINDNKLTNKHLKRDVSQKNQIN